jgi:SAM-dependent methyltransferase
MGSSAANEVSQVQMKRLVRVPCPFCNSNDGFSRVYADNPSAIVRCRHCDLVFFNPQPSQEYLAEFYSSQSGYMTSIEENLRSFQRNSGSWKATADFILGKVYEHLSEGKGQRILDVGCAYGFFLLFAKERGLDAYGVEVSSETSRYARDHGAKVRTGTLLEARFDSTLFDIVTLNNVLEHTLDPVAELREVFRILKNQGIVFLAVPNFGSLVAKVDNFYWHMKSWPNHLFYFTESTLKAILRKAGFSIVEVFTHQGESNYADDLRVIRDRLLISDEEELREIINLTWKLGRGQELVILAKKDEGPTLTYAPKADAASAENDASAMTRTVSGPEESVDGSTRTSIENPGARDPNTILFIATSIPPVVSTVFSRAFQDFPAAQFTIVAPSNYRHLFQTTVQFIPNEEIKIRPWRFTRRLRREKFDLTLVTLDGLPFFRRVKMWAFLTQRNVWIYDAKGDRTPVRVSSAGSWSRLWKEILLTRNHRAEALLDGAKLTFETPSATPPGLDERYAEKITKEQQHYTVLHSDSETLTEPANPALAYLLDRFQQNVRDQIGVDVWEYVVREVNRRPDCAILSLGSGPCGAEISLAKRFRGRYSFDCTDINPQLLVKGKEKALSLGLSFRFVAQDVNVVVLPERSYDIVFAHAAVHHFMALEHIFGQIKRALKPGGQFILYEVIPRNGMLMWPETNEVVQGLWKLLPDRFKYEHPWMPPEFRAERPDRDASVDGFECIRSQEIYPLAKKMFRTRIEVPGFVFARRFVDNDFGPNYDLSRPEDRAVIDLIIEMDRLYLKQGLLKPESIFMVLE